MGARGKKRRRKDGSIANGKVPLLRPGTVPRVTAAQVETGLSVLRDGLTQAGRPAWPSDNWEAVYRRAQDLLREVHGIALGDAMLWRATFLDALLDSADFQDHHSDKGVLPTTHMLEVAAAIPTYGDEESFDRDEFEARLEDLELGIAG